MVSVSNPNNKILSSAIWCIYQAFKPGKRTTRAMVMGEHSWTSNWPDGLIWGLVTICLMLPLKQWNPNLQEYFPTLIRVPTSVFVFVFNMFLCSSEWYLHHLSFCTYSSRSLFPPSDITLRWYCSSLSRGVFLHWVRNVICRKSELYAD